MKSGVILFVFSLVAFYPAFAQTLKFPVNHNTPHTAGHVKSGKIKIYYEIHGKGKPLILLHGGMGYIGHWGYQVEELKKHYRVIAIDARGHGRSRMPIHLYNESAFSYDLMAKDTLTVMDHLGITKATILGWSDGANTALTIAIKSPERISNALLYAANYNTSGLTPPGNNTYFSQYRKHCQDIWSHKQDFLRLRKAMKKMWRTQPRFTATQLGAIRVPVAVISGSSDEIIKSSHTEKMAKLIPDSKRIVIQGSSHFAHLQKPEQFNKAILDYLNSE